LAKTDAVSDSQIVRVLGLYAGMVDRVLANPERWLGLDEDPPPTAPLPLRALDGLRNRAFGDTTPASPEWRKLPAEKRVDWWVTRIGISAGLAAAAPRFAGALADRIPLQSALGASASGLAVCATALEYGRTEPAQWVPLLAKILFNRDVQAEVLSVPAAKTATAELATEPMQANNSDRHSKLTQGAKRAATTLWRLASAFHELHDLLDERPRGGMASRALAKLPVVGVAGGWLDERGGIRKSARQTRRLLATG
jgi:hypothetical protein